MHQECINFLSLGGFYSHQTCTFFVHLFVMQRIQTLLVHHNKAALIICIFSLLSGQHSVSFSLFLLFVQNKCMQLKIHTFPNNRSGP